MHLLIPVTADRGLAGAFNSNIGRATRTLARRLESEGKTVKILAVGRKGRDYLRRELATRITGDISYAGKKRIDFTDAEAIASRVTAMLAAGEIDVCTLIYNRFQSVISQVVTEQQLIPAPPPPARKTPPRPSAAPPTSSNPTRKPSSPACCPRRSPSQSIARCWKVPPASTARA